MRNLQSHNRHKHIVSTHIILYNFEKKPYFK